MKHAPTPVTLQIESLSHEGRGIAHIDGKTTFVDYALPGETISAQITKQKGRYNEAKTLDVIEASEKRVPARCPHFGTCGGCNLQHMQADMQLELKQQTVKELLQHQAQSTAEHWLPPLTSSEFQYRRKARLSVKYVDKKQKLLIGFREKQGRYVADIDYCDILTASAGHQLQAMAAMVEQLSIHKKIPQIEVAVCDAHTALIIRHLEPMTEQDHSIITRFAQTHRFHIYLQPKGIDSIHRLHPVDADKPHYAIPDYQLRMEHEPHHFTQINQSINLKMIAQALSLLELKPGDRVIDLFCGIGNFTLPMARQGCHVTGVEGSDDAIRQAKENAIINELENVDFFSANLFESVYNQDWSQRAYNKVLLDPPRAGAQEIIPLIATWRPSHLVYVSCNPATLARDIGLLTDHGYQLAQCGIMDMFPQTKHIETMALLTLSE
mgnify:CR=1 FL=1